MEKKGKEKMILRKPLDELTLEDLERCPVWEVALQEDERGGNPRLTITPRPDLTVVDPRCGTFIVKTEFIAKNGRVLYGYCSPNEDYDLGCIQPTVLAERRAARFRRGVRPRTVAPRRTRSRGRKTRQAIRFRALVAARGARLEGIIPKFVESCRGEQ